MILRVELYGFYTTSYEEESNFMYYYIKISFNQICLLLSHHHHLTRCIPLMEKLLIGSEEGRTTAIHTHKAERGQSSLLLIEKLLLSHILVKWSVDCVLGRSLFIGSASIRVGS